MKTEAYVVKSKHGHSDYKIFWVRVPFSPNFRSEEEAREFYFRNKDYIDKQEDNKEIGIFKHISDQIYVSSLSEEKVKVTVLPSHKPKIKILK